MSEKKRDLPPLPPMDLKEAEEIILRLDDTVSIMGMTTEGTTHVLANLLLVLHRLKVINAHDFLTWMLADSRREIENDIDRMAIEGYMTFLLARFDEQTLDGPGPIYGKTIH